MGRCWFGDAHAFEPIEPWLSGEEFTYVFMDCRGYGGMRGVPGDYTIDEIANDALTLADTLRIATGYRIDGEIRDNPPLLPHRYSECEPVYETLPGWSESSVGVTQYDKLPVNARLYLQRIEQVTGVPIHMVSTSPDRDHTILLHNPFAA